MPDTEVPVRLGEELARPRVAGLGCPRCGGAVEVVAGRRVMECPYCSMTLLALGATGVQRLAVEARLDAPAARQAVREWLKAGFRKHPALSREAHPEETMLCFLPFFRVQADVLAAALGVEERRDNDGNVQRRPVERLGEHHCDRTWPAVHVAEWGIRRVDLDGDRLVPFDADALARQGMVFPPTGSETEALETVLARFEDDIDPGADLDSVTFRHVETIHRRLTVIHYPLWLVRYRFRERSYHALVDGEGGTLAYGKAPGNDLWRAFALVAGQAGAAFLATTVLQNLGWIFEAEDLGEGILALFVFTGVLCAGMFLWGWHHFRWGAEVVEGTGVVEERDGGWRRPLVSALETVGWKRLARRVGSVRRGSP